MPPSKEGLTIGADRNQQHNEARMGYLPKRGWMPRIAVIATAVLSALAILRHDAAFSHAVSTVSITRSAAELLIRAKGTDPLIGAVHLINRWGVIVASTEKGNVGLVPLRILLPLSRSKEGKLVGETATDLIAGA